MVLLSELVKIVADVEGLDEVSVGIFARQAREAGHIKQGGRGRSAAKMDTQDAANLLIAVNACVLAKEVAEAIPVYRAMLSKSDEYTGKVKRLLKTAGVFQSEATFGSDLEDVISLCGDPDRRKVLSDIPVGAVIEFERPSPRAGVRIYIRDEAETTHIIRRFYNPAHRTSPADVGDRKDQTMISSRTLMAVAEALRN